MCVREKGMCESEGVLGAIENVTYMLYHLS